MSATQQRNFPPELIDTDAERVVRRLIRGGHQAYLVGGCVRDLLLKRNPKDFDVATSATPSEIRQLFRNCRIIGRRFRLAHIFFGSKIIETSTFRANPRNNAQSRELLIRRDNVFGSPTDDAKRRDFTINGLFYDLQSQQVIDHVGGIPDLEAGIVRTIGNPNIRFQEDPVRILRAIKFAARLNFKIEHNTFHALVCHHHELTKCAPPRILEELYRLLRSGAAVNALEHLVGIGIAKLLSPQLAALLDGQPAVSPSSLSPEDPLCRNTSRNSVDIHGQAMLFSIFAQRPTALQQKQALTWRILHGIDQITAQPTQLTNASLLATLTNAFVFEDILAPGMRTTEAIAVVNSILDPLFQELHVARRDAERTRQILLAQRRLAPSRRRRSKPLALVSRDYFHESLMVFSLINTATGGSPGEIEKWKKLQKQQSPSEQKNRNATRRRSRGGRRRRKRRSTTT